MGGAHLMHGAIHAPDAMRGLVLLDTSFRSPGAGRPPAASTAARRLFMTEAEALDRFRPMPPGPTREPALVEHVARHALLPVCGQIGRASCRARVCQYVLFSVVAVSLQKTTSLHHQFIESLSNTSFS